MIKYTHDLKEARKTTDETKAWQGEMHGAFSERLGKEGSSDTMELLPFARELECTIKS